MKKILLTLSVMLFVTAGWAQNKAIDELFDKYSGKEGFTSVVITKHMFNLFTSVETTEDDEYMNMLKDLKNIKILSAPGSDVSGINFYDEVMKSLPAKEYDELMVIKDGEKDIKFLIKEEKNTIISLIMLIGGTEENVLISISGIIDMKTIAKLSKSMNIEGMENLDKINKKFPL